MTNNEIIAKWAGFTKLDKPEPITLSWAPGHFDTGPTLHHWRDPEGTYWIDAPEYSRDITLWHGPHRLLKLIEGGARTDVLTPNGYLRRFLTELVGIVRGSQGVIAREDDGSEWVEVGTAWALLRASAADLAAALVAVIKEVR